MALVFVFENISFFFMAKLFTKKKQQQQRKLSKFVLRAFLNENITKL